MFNLLRIDSARVKAVIFDFDGVLVDSVPIKTQAFADLFSDVGVDPGQLAEILRFHVENGGLSRQIKIRHAFEKVLGRAISESDVREYAERYGLVVRQKVTRAAALPGSMELVQSLFGKTELFISSGTPEGELLEIVRERGMARYFRGVRGSPDAKPVHIREFLSVAGCSPSEALFIGDSRNDYLAAEECGVVFASVPVVGG